MMASVSHFIRTLGADAADLLFPPSCACCGDEWEASFHYAQLCGECVEKIAPAGVLRCPRCGSRIPPGLRRGADCESCRGNRQSFEAVWTLGEYEGLLRRATLRTKQPAGEILAKALAKLCIDRHADEWRSWRPDWVAPTPMHWLRRLWRGANAAEIISELIAQKLSTPCATNGVRRRRFTQPQAGLPPRDRRSNLRGAFQVHSGYDFKGARVLVVDDILTTGATLGEIGRVLRSAGAAAVAGAVLARTSSPS